MPKTNSVAAELRDLLNRSQAAKAGKIKADAKLKRAEQARDAAHAEVTAAAVELRESDAALQAGLKRNMALALKKGGDVAMAMAGIMADAMEGVVHEQQEPAREQADPDPAPPVAETVRTAPSASGTARSDAGARSDDDAPGSEEVHEQSAAA